MMLAEYHSDITQKKQNPRRVPLNFSNGGKGLVAELNVYLVRGAFHFCLNLIYTSCIQTSIFPISAFSLRAAVREF